MDIIAKHNWVGNVIPYISQTTRGPFFIAQMGREKVGIKKDSGGIFGLFSDLPGT